METHPVYDCTQESPLCPPDYTRTIRDLKHKIKIQSPRTVRARVQLIIIEE